MNPLPHTVTDIAAFRKIMVFAPHPDDEVLGCGGTLALAALGGAEIRVIIVTDGGYGEFGRLQAARLPESQAAAAVLGYPPPTTWELPDQGLRAGHYLIQRLVDALSDWQPDLVLGPSVWEVHPDHVALGRALVDAVGRLTDPAKTALWLYEVGQPLPTNCLVDITPLAETKRKAVACFGSQLSIQAFDRQIDGLNAYRTYTLPPAIERAEAFYAVAANLAMFAPHAISGPYAESLTPQTAPLVSVLLLPDTHAAGSALLPSLAIQRHANLEACLEERHAPAASALAGCVALRPVDLPLGAPGAVLTRLLAAATGDWAMAAFEGQWFLPDHIAGLLAAISNEGPDVVAAVGGAMVLSADNGELISAYYGPLTATEAAQIDVPVSGCILFRRDAIESAALQDLTDPLAIAPALLAQLATRGRVIGVKEPGLVMQAGQNPAVALEAPGVQRERHYAEQVAELARTRRENETLARQHEGLNLALNAAHQRAAEMEQAIARLQTTHAGQLAEAWRVHAERVAGLSHKLLESEEAARQAAESWRVAREALVSAHGAEIASLREHYTHALAAAEQALTQQQAQLAEAVRTYEGSLSWRLTAPLRWLGDVVRRVRPAWLRGLRPRLGARLAANAQRWERVDLPALMRDPGRLPRALGYRSVQPVMQWPALDLSLVTYNSSRWLKDFFASLQAQQYPLGQISVLVVDHGSRDDTWLQLQQFQQAIGEQFARFDIEQAPNLGFGAGHNRNLRKARAPWFWVSNVDLVWLPDTLTQAIASAQSRPEGAGFECRQMPYEHPKYYDPVTLETAWSSCACMLFRRDVLQQLGGFDDRIFMYGEDVELSYRLRANGHRLFYLPNAAVHHYTYEQAHEVKPLQFSGSLSANLLLRLRYGTGRDIRRGVLLALLLLTRPEDFAGQRKLVRKAVWDTLRKAAGFLSLSRPQHAFGFINLDYELVRTGAYLPVAVMPQTSPLVSIIIRTYQGRRGWLRESLASACQQAYPAIEIVVVEDGGDTHGAWLAEQALPAHVQLQYLPLEKVGRSAAGNAAMAAARGEFMVFLDDDDLLLADHVATLVSYVADHPEIDAVFADSWRVDTDARLEGEAVYYTETRYAVFPEARHEFAQLAVFNFMPIQSVLFRRWLFDALGGFEVDLDALEDWLLWYKFSLHGRFAKVDKLTSLFRVPADPVVQQRRQKILDDHYEIALARQVGYRQQPRVAPPVRLGRADGEQRHA